MAAPKEINVIFLSSVDSVSLLDLFYLNTVVSKDLYVQATTGVNAGCVEFGDKCFHPQKGLVEKGEEAHGFQVYDNNKELKYDFADAESNENKIDLDSVNSEFSHNLDCKEQEFFDIYCGKANKIKVDKVSKKRKGGFEVWIDTSTSMRDSDYQFKSGTCYREDFVQRLRSKCSNVQVYQYASSKKQIGSTKTLCENHEQNNLARFKQWVKESTADSVLIITDAGSVDLEFQQLIDSLGGKMTGIEDRMIGVKHLKDYVDKYQKVCQRLKK